MDITEYIIATRDSFLDNGLVESLWEINNGQCDTFAEIITFAGYGILIWQDELEDFTEYTFGEHKQEIINSCHHCFIYYKGRFYDSDSPEGYEHPIELPLFENGLKEIIAHGYC